jgi:hypothetical protein
MTTMHWTITARMTTAVAATMLLMGCAHKGAQFGDSVRHMTEQQIFDLDAAYNPDPNPLQGGDADRLNNALEAHRNGTNSAEAAGAMTGVSSGNR